MDKEKSFEQKYWWIILLIIIIGFIYIRSLPDEDITFLIKSGEYSTRCWSEDSDLTITYDISSSSAIDLVFTSGPEDAENINKTSYYYNSCYFQNILNNKGDCLIEGDGCLLLINKGTQDATVHLKYSADF